MAYSGSLTLPQPPSKEHPGVKRRTLIWLLWLLLECVLLKVFGDSVTSELRQPEWQILC